MSYIIIQQIKMGGCASSIEANDNCNAAQKSNPGSISLTKADSGSQANINDADLTLGAKINEEELEKAVERIFERFDLDKDSILSIDEIATLLKSSYKHNREVTAKDAEEFVSVLTCHSGTKV